MVLVHSVSNFLVFLAINIQLIRAFFDWHNSFVASVDAEVEVGTEDREVSADGGASSRVFKVRFFYQLFRCHEGLYSVDL